MKGSLGCPTRIITLVPHQRYLNKRQQGKMSAKAKQRLKIFDWYFNRSGDGTGRLNVALTCRHFGIYRSYFYRWIKRYDGRCFAKLEDKSRTPKTTRLPLYSQKLIDEVYSIRKDHPTWSAKKIHKMLLRTHKSVSSIATIGRLIQREKLFFRADAALRRKKHRATIKSKSRKRKPYGLKATKPHEIIEFDMKYIYVEGRRLYAMCAIDTFTREAYVRVCGTSTSYQAREALKDVVNRFGKSITIVCDNGSENGGFAEQWLAEAGITQFWTKPHTPKDKPMIERFIGTLQYECLNEHYDFATVEQMQGIIDNYLDDYHHIRPHEGIGLLTPQEKCAIFGLSIPHSKVSYML